MSGGGAHGSFEAGALWGMYYSAKDKQSLAYDVVTGVSAGAINSLAVSFYPPG
jgi:predicted acylesterase/phospholipase RssA